MNREDNVEQQAEEPETLGSLENELEAVANENPFSYQTETQKTNQQHPSPDTNQQQHQNQQKTTNTQPQQPPADVKNQSHSVGTPYRPEKIAQVESPPATKSQQKAISQQRLPKRPQLDIPKNLSKAQFLRKLATDNFTKKRQNFQRLKEWDRHRSQQLALHKSIVQELQHKIDRSIKASIENLEIYINFMRQKAKQQEKYASHPVIDTKTATQNNELCRNIYINCSLLLNAMSQENTERCKRAQNLALHLRKNVLADLLEDHLKRSQLELLKIREKVSTLRATLQKSNVQTQRKTVKLATHFQQDQTNVGLSGQKDFYKRQLSFIKKAYEQTRIQKKLGQVIYEYLKIAMAEELKRADVIRKAISMYVDGLRQAYAVQFDEDSLSQLKKHEQQKLVPEFYAIEEMLGAKLLFLMKERLNEEGSDEQLLKKFIDRLKFKQFQNAELILKEFEVAHDVARGKTEMGTLYITVDNFLLVFLNSEQTHPYCKPSTMFKIDKTLNMTQKEHMSVEFKKKEEKKGVMSYLMWDTKKEPGFSLRFLKAQAKQQFQKLIQILI